MASANAAGGGDPAWKTLLAAEIYRRSGQRASGSPVASLVDSHIRSLSNDALDPWGVDVDSFGGGIPGGGITVKGPRDPVPGKSSACCLVKFMYPIPTPVAVEKATSSKVAWLGWTFKVLAIYKKAGTDPNTGLNCKCECCEFQQMRHGDQTWTKLGDKTKKPRVDKKSGEDCATVRQADGKEKRVCYGDRAKELEYSDDTKDHSYEVYSDSGEVKGGPPGLQEVVDEQLAELELERDQVCLYYMVDRPGLTTSRGYRFKYDMCFQGLINQVTPCKPKPIIEDKFRLYMDGVASVVKGSTGSNKTLVSWRHKPEFVPKCKPTSKGK